MSVVKDSAERYTVRNGHEHASIVLRCWDIPPRPTGYDHTTYGGEIMIHSTYGSWGNTWGACSNPFKQFLLGCDFHYLFGKLMGAALDCFDGEASVAAMRKLITSERRDGMLNRTEARQVWDALDEVSSQAEHGEHDFADAMFCVAREIGRDHSMHQHFADPCSWPRCHRDDYQASGFWKEIWPEFTATLRAELATTTQALAAA